MGQSSQEDRGVTGKSCGSPPQRHNPSYSGVIPRGVNNNPAVYPETGHNPETPSASTTRSSRTPPRRLPAGLCDGSGSRGTVCSAPALARDGRRAGRRWGRRWGLTCPALTHSETGGGPAAASCSHAPGMAGGVVCLPCPRALGKVDEGQSCRHGGEELGGFPACLRHRWASAALTGRDPHPMAAPAQPCSDWSPGPACLARLGHEQEAGDPSLRGKALCSHKAERGRHDGGLEAQARCPPAHSVPRLREGGAGGNTCAGSKETGGFCTTLSSGMGHCQRGAGPTFWAGVPRNGPRHHP